ncbi:gas vesicle protein GvpO [Pseudonocardia asaccharolytica]|uniref:Gas vesicle protein n=1 Tax=Pseudonocardia asaccharolytica DSM 44247 = NBRC 16224 TaxID=1123024 RepID=A0A511CYE8_9PSEU|nr:gas vesicle protein GvpO [Pseudonocardia asaccharolytica]GEL17586.1 hypothetical protein PA7_14230 [Pseudonocardia asaccharolytica DSM 44247 = NBRC 16224]
MVEEERRETPRPRRRRPEQPDVRARGGAGRNGQYGPAESAARKAAATVAAFTGREPECVISVERCDDGWQVGVEVVETRRIPDSTDILANYVVRLEPDGELISYRRTCRYTRSQVNRETR